MKYENIIFDFDGTVADTGEGVLSSVRYALEKTGVIPPGEEVLRKFIGPTLYRSFRDLIGLSREASLKAIDLYREYYIPHGVYMCKLYEGIEETLCALKESGYKLSIASAKPQRQLEIAVNHLGITHYFDKIVGADPSSISNDKDYILEQAKLSDRVVMVGDSPFDMQAAKRLGFDTIAVLYGFSSEQVMSAENPTFTAQDCNEIRKILID